MSDVAIVGIGMHAVRTSSDQRSRAGSDRRTRRALADAGIALGRRRVRLRRLVGGRAPRTRSCRISGSPACRSSTSPTAAPPAGARSISAYNACDSGTAEVVMAIGFDKHPRGAFDPMPADYGIGEWYGETGLMLTTQFFGMKIQRYMHEHASPGMSSPRSPRRRSATAPKNPNAWRRTPMSEDDILDATMIADPLTQYMFCSPGRGCGGARATTAERAASFRGRPSTCARRCSARGRSARSRCSIRRSPTSVAIRRASPPAAGAFEMAGHRPGRHRRRPGAGHRVGRRGDAPRRVRVLRRRRAGGPRSAAARPRSPGRCRSTPTADAWPTASRSVRPDFARSTSRCVQLRGDAGERQVPGNPQPAFTHVYGAPGISACTVLSR